MSSIAGQGLMGVEYSATDAPDDPFIVTSAVLNHPVVAGPVDKHRREDLEFWSALHALAYHGIGRHPLGVLTGDKPDRKLVQGDNTWGTELTQLTVSDITSSKHPTPREQMAQVHRFRDRLQQRLESDRISYSHLHGRAVTIQKNPREVLPRKDDPLVYQIAEALKEDRGFFTLADNPDHVERGLYGSFGPFSVTVQSIPGIGEIGIFASCDFPIRRSDAIAALAERVAIKDKPGNDILIITCCVPDAYGWVSAPDHAIFRQLFQARESGVTLLNEKPAHIRGVLIHESPDSPGLILLHESEDVPWSVKGRSTILTSPPPGPRFRRPGNL